MARTSLLGVAQPSEAALQAGKGIGDRKVVNLHRWLASQCARAAAIWPSAMPPT